MGTHEMTLSQFHARESKALPILKRTQNPLSAAQKLPFEVLDLIFDYFDVAQDRFKRTQGVRDYEIPWISLVRVCRQWYGRAVGRLYASIDLKTEDQVVKLYDTLRTGPHFRSLVRALHLPLTFPDAPAPHIHVLYCRVINLVKNLEDLSVPTKFLTNADIKRTGSSWDSLRIVLPIAPDRHHTLRALTIDCNSHFGLTIFPHSLTLFVNLRYLCLVSLSLSRRVHPSVTPPLPLLETIIFMYDPGTEELDEWMCASPNLTTIGFWRTCPADMTPRIISNGRITRVEMLLSFPVRGSFTGLRARWLNDCVSLRQLRISGDVFVANSRDIPVELEELRIEMIRPPYPAVEDWKRYFDRGTRVQRLILSFHICDPSAIDAGQRAHVTAVGYQVAICLEYAEGPLHGAVPRATKKLSAFRVVQGGRKLLRA